MEDGERESDRVAYSFGHVADEIARPETAAEPERRGRGE